MPMAPIPNINPPTDLRRRKRSKMVQYQIPNLLNLLQPYIKPINPNYDVIQSEYLAWIGVSPFLSDAHKKGYQRAELPLLMSRIFPDSSVGYLRVAVQCMKDSLLMETLTDTPATSVHGHKWADIFIQAFKEILGEVEGPSAMIKHLTDRVLSAIKQPYKPIVAGTITLAEGLVKEVVGHGNAATKLTWEAYLKTRRDAINFRSFFAMGRWIQNIDISTEVLEHPDIIKLEKQACHLVFLANDLYSYKKEFLQSDAHHNYVTAVLESTIAGLSKNDRQGAIDYTCRKFSESLADFQRLRETLPSFGESEDAQIVLYIGVMMDLIVGSIQWSLSCQRYGHNEKAEPLEGQTWGEVVFEMDPL